MYTPIYSYAVRECVRTRYVVVWISQCVLIEMPASVGTTYTNLMLPPRVHRTYRGLPAGGQEGRKNKVPTCNYHPVQCVKRRRRGTREFRCCGRPCIDTRMGECTCVCVCWTRECIQHLYPHHYMPWRCIRIRDSSVTMLWRCHVFHVLPTK